MCYWAHICEFRPEHMVFALDRQWFCIRWEWFISLDFDWQYISREKPFLWPLVRSSPVSSYCVLNPFVDILFFEQIHYAVFTRGHVGSSFLLLFFKHYA